MNFEDYLKSKKIDARAFELAEKATFMLWQAEFEQMHPNSFTVQKLNLINPIRRKYTLVSETPADSVSAPAITAPPPPAQVSKPAMRPKPKMN